MAPTSLLSAFLITSGLVSAKFYFKEDFNSPDWEKRWTTPTNWKPLVNLS
jgi:hypothetical protein